MGGQGGMRRVSDSGGSLPRWRRDGKELFYLAANGDLLAVPTTPHGEARMQAMTESGDGFELAERDLIIRGAGEVFGERQAGWTDLKLGRLPHDEAIVFEARGVAEEILDVDPDLERHWQLREEVQDLLGDAVDFLFKS